jgi:murein DD-endopeptidase MepM/ murein hydrolase activator NlpD
MPVGCRVSSNFGIRIDPVYKTQQYHKGMDFACPVGTDVHAAMSGTATAIHSITAGNMVMIDSGSERTRYLHNNNFISPIGMGGSDVSAGALIAKSGNTGKSTGPHVHFEHWVGGAPVDPATTCSEGSSAQPAPDSASAESPGYVDSKSLVPGYTYVPDNTLADIQNDSLMAALASMVSSKIMNPAWYLAITNMPESGLLAEISSMVAMQNRVDLYKTQL